MDKCDKWCVANYNGVCAAEKCRGEIRSLREPGESMEACKQRYEAAREASLQYFRPTEIEGKRRTNIGK